MTNKKEYKPDWVDKVMAKSEASRALSSSDLSSSDVALYVLGAAGALLAGVGIKALCSNSSPIAELTSIEVSSAKFLEMSLRK